jgi:adenylate cyclase class 2
MGVEHEVRKLNIDLIKMVEKVESVGAKRKGVFCQKRYVYDVIPPQKGRWIRLRSNGEITTLTVKEITSREIDGTTEEEIIVSDFEGTNRVLTKLGYVARSFQENIRIEYILNGVVLDIDKWPMIPPHIEIESNTQDDLFRVLDVIGIKRDEVTTMDIDTVYREVYGINIDDISHLVFTSNELKCMDGLLQKHYPFITGILSYDRD